MPISSIVIPVIVNVPSDAVVVDAPGRSLAPSSVTCTRAPPTGNPVALSRTRALKKVRSRAMSAVNPGEAVQASPKVGQTSWPYRLVRHPMKPLS